MLFSPRQFLDGLLPDRPLGGSVTYFLICSATTAVINTVATLAFLTVPAGMALATGSIEAGMLVRILAIFVLAPLVVLPVLFVAGFFASVQIQHLFILLVAGAVSGGYIRHPARLLLLGGRARGGGLDTLGRHPCCFLQLLPACDGPEAGHKISTSRSLGAILMLTTLLLALATVLAVYDYGLIREAMR